jgi:hypothetical protein
MKLTKFRRWMQYVNVFSPYNYTLFLLFSSFNEPFLIHGLLLLFMSMGWDDVTEFHPPTGLLFFLRCYMNIEPRRNDTYKGKLKNSEINLSQCVHHEVHMDWPGCKSGPLRWEAGDWAPESWHRKQATNVCEWLLNDNLWKDAFMTFAMYYPITFWRDWGNPRLTCDMRTGFETNNQTQDLRNTKKFLITILLHPVSYLLIDQLWAEKKMWFYVSFLHQYSWM